MWASTSVNNKKRAERWSEIAHTFIHVNDDEQTKSLIRRLFVLSFEWRNVRSNNFRLFSCCRSHRLLLFSHIYICSIRKVVEQHGNDGSGSNQLQCTFLQLSFILIYEFIFHCILLDSFNELWIHSDKEQVTRFLFLFFSPICKNE